MPQMTLSHTENEAIEILAQAQAARMSTKLKQMLTEEQDEKPVALSGYVGLIAETKQLKQFASMNGEQATNGHAKKPAKKTTARHPNTGQKRDMRCRHGEGKERCKNRSKGPRFHFLCEEHIK